MPKRTLLYYWWILAFALKAVGASWDAAYHFKYLRDFLQLPHLVNGAGDVLAIFLVIAMARSGTRGRAFATIIAGLFIFAFGVIFDQIYHQIHGIDLTTWSPSHFTLYLGTLVMLLGVMRQLAKDASYDAITPQFCSGALFIFSLFFLDCFWFPLLQQEQGTITFALIQKGIFTAGPDLRALITHSAVQIFSDVPEWLYGIYAGLAMAFSFQFIRAISATKYPATMMAGGYVAARLIMDYIFSANEYPQSTTPYFLVLSALIFDLASPLFFEKKQSGLSLCVLALFTTIPLISIALIAADPPLAPSLPAIALVLAPAAAAFGILLARFLRPIFFPDDILVLQK